MRARFGAAALALFVGALAIGFVERRRGRRAGRIERAQREQGLGAEGRVDELVELGLAHLGEPELTRRKREHHAFFRERHWLRQRERYEGGGGLFFDGLQEGFPARGRL